MRPNQNFINSLTVKDAFSYDVYGNEVVYYQFTTNAKISSSQTIRVYYTNKSSVSIPSPLTPTNNLTNISLGNFVYTDNSGTPDAPSNRNLQAPSLGAWSDSGSYAQIVTFGTSSCVWNEWPITGQTDQYNLDVGNTYWFPFQTVYGYQIDKTGSSKVMVYRNDEWITLTNSGRITWSSVI
jgi:hypothetical protein